MKKFINQHIIYMNRQNIQKFIADIIHIPVSNSVQKVLQLLAPAGMAQLSEGLGLDLADALPGDVEFLADFLQRAGPSIFNAEAQFEHFFLPGGEGGQHLYQLFLQ